MRVHLAAASGRSPDANQTQDAARSRRWRARAERLVSGPASCRPASRSTEFFRPAPFAVDGCRDNLLRRPAALKFAFLAVD